MEPLDVQATQFPNIITFTNRRSDANGFGVIYYDDTNSSVSFVPFNLIPAPGYYKLLPGHLATDLTFDSFDVNSAQAIAILPANRRHDQIGLDHPDYAFVTAFNLYSENVPSQNPDHPDRILSLPAGSNIAIIRNPFNRNNFVAPPVLTDPDDPNLSDLQRIDLASWC